MQVFVSEDFQNLHTDQTLKMSSTESVKENTFVLIHYLFSGNNTTHWKTVPHTFGQCDNIRFESCPSVSPEFLSNSSETSLNLISNDHTAVFFDKLSHSWAIACWNRIDSSYALNRLEDHSCDFSMNSVRLESLLGVFEQKFSRFDDSSVLTWP